MDEQGQVLSYEESAQLGEEIASISSHIDAATHRLLTCIRRFDEGEGWGGTGALSCAHWLTWRIGLSAATAREYVRIAKALAGLPKVDEALRRGQISYCKARAITRVATAENESTLLEWARSSTGAQLEKVCSKYRRVARYKGFIPSDDPEFRYVRKRDTPTGMVQVTAQLLPEEAAILMKAIDVAKERATKARAEDVSAETSGELGRRLETERREYADSVDGLLWLAEAMVGGTVGDAPSSSPVEVLVHVEQRDLVEGDDTEAALDDGRRLEAETTERLLCDASVVRVVEDENGTPLDVGQRTRTIPTALRRALRVRDAGCRFPGCDRMRTDGHHVVPWSKGGTTALGNLVSLCRRHHRFVHEQGWRIESHEGNEILFSDTFGSLASGAAIRTTLHDDVIRTLRDERAADGIDIDATTAEPYAGGRVNYGLAVEALLYNHLLPPDVGRAFPRKPAYRPLGSA